MQRHGLLTSKPSTATSFCQVLEYLEDKALYVKYSVVDPGWKL